MLEQGRRLAKGIPGCPNVRLDSAGSFLNRLEERTKGRLPKWVGELYLEYHRGTYTTMAKNKRWNRQCEFLLQDSEWLAAMDSVLCGGVYPAAALRENWEKVLTRQFHDIIPGSSIKPVYDECEKTYPAILSAGEAMLQTSLEHLAARIGTDGGVLVVNPNSFASRGFVELDGRRVYAQGVPPKGYAVLPLAETVSQVQIGDHKLENAYFAVTFDAAYEIVSLYDKRCDREVIQPGQRANAIRAFADFPHNYDAWDINNYYQETSWELRDVTAAEPVRDGVGGGFRITRKFQRSTLIQTIWLYDRLDRIDFDTWVDWHEDHLLVKTAFPVDVHADRASYEIQFGALERPTHSNTSWDNAKFEVCAHKFADLSEYGYGVSLLNDCKYGCDIHDGVMRLTLLKCATWPNPQADQGEHRFCYALYPHRGTWREADTVALAFDLNNPLRALPVATQNGSLPETFSLVHSTAENLVVDTVKQAEDGDGWIIRLYECRGQRTTADLEFGVLVRGAWLCDLLEREETALKTEGGRIALLAKPYEIITLKVKS